MRRAVPPPSPPPTSSQTNPNEFNEIGSDSSTIVNSISATSQRAFLSFLFFKRILSAVQTSSADSFGIVERWRTTKRLQLGGRQGTQAKRNVNEQAATAVAASPGVAVVLYRYMATSRYFAYFFFFFFFFFFIFCCFFSDLNSIRDSRWCDVCVWKLTEVSRDQMSLIDSRRR